MQPIFLNLTRDLHGAIVAGPNGSLVVSVFHEPSGRTLFGREQSMKAAHSWMDAAKLIFVEAEGKA